MHNHSFTYCLHYLFPKFTGIIRILSTLSQFVNKNRKHLLGEHKDNYYKEHMDLNQNFCNELNFVTPLMKSR